MAEPLQGGKRGMRWLLDEDVPCVDDGRHHDVNGHALRKVELQRMLTSETSVRQAAKKGTKQKIQNDISS